MMALMIMAGLLALAGLWAVSSARRRAVWRREQAQVQRERWLATNLHRRDVASMTAAQWAAYVQAGRHIDRELNIS